MKKLILCIVSMCAINTFASNLNQSSNGDTLHMIIFADTKDDSIGKSCLTDYLEMSQLAEYVSNNTSLNLKTYYRKATVYKKREMLRLLKDLKVAPNDVVFFYYSGHGYRTMNSKSPYPRMFVTNKGNFNQNNQGVSVEKVRGLISKKNPRLSVIMVDACNTMFGIKEPSSGVSGEGNIELQLKRLFVDFKGEIIMCGSKPGDGQDGSGQYTGYSWSNSQDGGFFTFNFRTAFQRTLRSNSPANWKALLSKTKQMTINFSKKELHNQLQGNHVQIPMYKLNKL